MKNINQYGRSMVEMLGVLAIVGVLSVGAIAGYSKAMFKYKMNKTMDIISHAVARVAELDTMKLGTEILTAQDMIDYGIMPDCDLDYIGFDESGAEDNRSCPLPLGEIRIDFAQWDNVPLYGEFYIYFLQEPFESCVAFFTSEIYKNVPEDWWDGGYKMVNWETEGGRIDVSNSNAEGGIIYAKSEYIVNDSVAKSELSNTDILEACEICKDSTYCEIYWVVRNDL